MVPTETLDKPVDPVELINETLERAWGTISAAYDVTTSLPDMRELFEGTNLRRPGQAAEIVIANMLMEVVECISRFSPWYKLPARAFGLISVRDRLTNHVRWALAPVEMAIRKYSGLIQAIILVDDLMINGLPNDPCVTASCLCLPPRKIKIKQSILEQAEIVCDLCKHPFT
jgi:hypothetical protein